MIERAIFSKNYFNILKKIIYKVDPIMKFEIIRIIDILFEILQNLTQDKIINI